MLIFIISNFIIFNLFTCENVEKKYLIGDYKKCIDISTQSNSCDYIKSLCMLALKDYYSSKILLNQINGEFKPYANISLSEIDFLEGNYKKTNMINLNKHEDQYLDFLNKILYIKASYDKKELKKVKTILASINTENYLTRPVNPWCKSD